MPYIYPIAIGIGRARGLGRRTVDTRGRCIRGLVGPSSGIGSRPAVGRHGCWPWRADALGPTLNYPSPPVCFPPSDHPGSSIPVFTGTLDGAGTEPAANFMLGLLPTAEPTPPPTTGGSIPALVPASSPAGTPGASANPREVSGLPLFAAVLPRLIKRIVAKEFIDISEMLPEAWRAEPSSATAGVTANPVLPHTGVTVFWGPPVLGTPGPQSTGRIGTPSPIYR